MVSIVTTFYQSLSGYSRQVVAAHSSQCWNIHLPLHSDALCESTMCSLYYITTQCMRSNPRNIIGTQRCIVAHQTCFIQELWQYLPMWQSWSIFVSMHILAQGQVICVNVEQLQAYFGRFVTFEG